MVTALPLVWIACTGMILSFHDRNLSQSELPLHSLPLENWITLALKNETGTLSSIEFPRDSQLPIRLRLSDSNGKYQHSVWISPKDGSVEPPSDNADFTEWVYRLHRGSFAGTPGRGGATFMGILVPVLWIGGLAIRKKATHRYRPARKVALRYHRKVGLWLGGVLAVVTLSGAVLNFYTEIVGVIDPLTPTVSSAPLAYKEKNPVSLTQGILQALHVRPNPDARLLGVYLRKGSPAGPMDRTLYYFSDNSRVYLNKHNNSVEKIMNPKTQWIHFLLPLHSGRFLGQVGQFIIFAIGLGAVAMIGLGLQSSLKLDVSRRER